MLYLAVRFTLTQPNDMTRPFPKIDLNQTICAIATPRGRGGLGVIRLSGPDAIAIADRVFRGQKSLADQAGYTVHHGMIVKPESGAEIDEVIVTLFRAPKSFSGEDLVEISVHGGTVILDNILTLLTDQGAILAAPGEFTLRAFLNGRIDLTKAEAVADIIGAKTEESAAAALKQLQGNLFTEVQALRSDLLAILARLEIDIDFTEEDIDPAVKAESVGRLGELATRVARILSGYRRGHILRDGFTVVLAGPPNAGKSTLFNRLAQDERAIVTEVPGTTRDVLREFINLDGYPACLVDTAGIRETVDIVEKIGVERSTQAVGGADALIWLVDLTADLSRQLPDQKLLRAELPMLICCNKIDAAPQSDAAVIEVLQLLGGKPEQVSISAKTGDGIEQLLAVIRGWIRQTGIDQHDSALSINERHRVALSAALKSVEAATRALADGAETELAIFDVKSAAVALGEIIGETTTDEILGEIFGNFCIGK